MNTAQIAEFQNASGVDPHVLLLVIASVVMVAYTLWTAWVAQGQLRQWAQREASIYDLLWTVIRASILLLLVGWFIR